jgi:hypothetical protein
MQGFLEALAATYGGGAGYLRTHGMSEAELASLRHQLVAA